MSTVPGYPQPAPQAPAPHPAPSVQYRKALRVARAIAIVKWFLIVVVAIAAAVLAVHQLSTDAGSDLENLGPLLVAAIALAGLLLILLLWVLFGWFEHVLRLLVTVADHTR